MKQAHETFVREYQRHGDARRAALAAGSLERLSEADAARWLAREDVQKALLSASPVDAPPAAPSEEARARSTPSTRPRRRAPVRRTMRKK